MMQQCLKSEEFETLSFNQKKEWSVISLEFISLRVTKLQELSSQLTEERNEEWKEDKSETEKA